MLDTVKRLNGVEYCYDITGGFGVGYCCEVEWCWILLSLNGVVVLNTAVRLNDAGYCCKVE